MIVIGFILAAMLGGVVRWRASELNTDDLPRGTLAVNVGAAFVAGLLIESSPTVAVIASTALLGSLSTFSTLMGELVDRRDRRSVAAIYLAVTIVGGVLAAWLGLTLAP
ncbi:fluoride efflux transporter FluC [Ilumatobacter coccineus]|uniref:Fluoride-specific ion channel FluC n=1 Tax=Ilumatobacter coccineus (strain NBRC 103263 / KCTC 29153 / YM16-304) TaxID=1313172 RepID=A0A6C7E2H2_ILUCY|nr:CrcB family protein [Ilumatobacter coccineus]BAN00993.1 CrcB protein homolog [Ilumatobacter coccineus YM16-304]